MHSQKRRQPGYLIVYAIIMMFGLMSIGLTVLTIASATYTYSKDDVHRQNAAYMAKACVSVIANELTADSSFSGFSPADKTLFDRTSENGSKATCTVDSITAGTGNQKIVQLTSSVYRSNTDTSPVEYQAQALFDATSVGVVDGDYLKGGVLVGNGGMSMEGVGVVYSPRINILGDLALSGSVAFIAQTGYYGDGPVNVYNIACETTTTPSNWPQPCTAQDPIQLDGSANVHGDICAPGQTSTLGLYWPDPNCTDSSDLPEIAMPPFNKAGFINGLTGPTISSSDIIREGGCYRNSTIPSKYYGQAYHVPAGATIVGDINLSSVPYLLSGKCTIVFDGDTYITGGVTGALDMFGQVEFTVKNGISENIVIVMNRQINIDGANYFSFVPNSSGKLAHIINFNSSNTVCSDSDTIPSSSASTCLTPSQAKTSATVDTYKGLDLSSGGGYKNLSGVTYYAYYSMLDLGCGSSYIRVAAIAAQRIAICDGGSAIQLTASDPTFGITADSSSGGGEYYVVDFFQR